MNEDNFEFFWHGPFSQWMHSPFTVDGVEYTCAEQYMMAMKADTFGDKESLKKIMATEDPREQKALGRKVKGFKPETWDKLAKAFVYRANLSKFSNPILKQILLNTGDKELVEASPYDKIWGIGMSETDPDRLDKTKWKGTNWLGEVLMQVRDTLKKQA